MKSMKYLKMTDELLK